MTRAIILDTCVLSVASNPNASARECREWVEAVKQGGSMVVIPAIADYELRRELVRQANTNGLASLDSLCASSVYLPLSDSALKIAARFWAMFRNTIGKQPSDPTAHRLDADVIICAQARAYAEENGLQAIIATDNLKDFRPLLDATFVTEAKPWTDIDP